MKRFLVVMLLAGLLVGCSGFEPGQAVQISTATLVNVQNFSPYRQWYVENGGCTVEGTATIVEKGNYLPDMEVQLYLVETPNCTGWIADSKLSLP